MGKERLVIGFALSDGRTCLTELSEGATRGDITAIGAGVRVVHIRVILIVAGKRTVVVILFVKERNVQTPALWAMNEFDL